MSFRAYYTLSKPGIIYGNLFVAVGAFLMASGWPFSVSTIAGLILGLGGVIGSAGALNNYFDRDIDSKMERTKLRPSVTGELSSAAMVAWTSVLGLTGALILYYSTNLTATVAALFGCFAYIVFYTLISKRRSAWGTFVGGLSGAMPPVVGYTAVTSEVDPVAITLFLMLFFWQMPHAHAIALFRVNDYRSANLPVLPVVHGIDRTKTEILIYVILFTITSPFLFIFKAVSIWYVIISIVVSLYWLYTIYQYGRDSDTIRFGKKVFLKSLIVLIVCFVAMAIDSSVV